MTPQRKLNMLINNYLCDPLSPVHYWMPISKALCHFCWVASQCFIKQTYSVKHSPLSTPVSVFNGAEYLRCVLSHHPIALVGTTSAIPSFGCQRPS